MANLTRIAAFADWRRAAQRRLPRLLFDYIDGGSFGEVTLARNAADFDAVRVEQRVLRDTDAIDPAIDLFDQSWAMPLALASIGFAGMYARRGEVQAARAARAAGVPFCLSTVGICSIEEVTAAAGAPWFQLYMTRDRGFMAELLARAKAAGCPTLVFTVDMPAPGPRYRDWRSGMAAQPDLAGRLRQALDGLRHPRWLADVYLGGRPHGFGNLSGVLSPSASFADAWDWIRANFDRSTTWDDLAFVRRHWDGPIVIKGILHPDDAAEAVYWGATGIVVSNHGGRQLDGVASTASMLPAIADRVAGRARLIVDGGIRSGLDILRARTLGADAAMMGKAWAYALAAAGEAGVARLLRITHDELVTAMVLSGQADFAAAPTGTGIEPTDAASGLDAREAAA